VVDEGASTCIMYIYYWKALGSPKLDTSIRSLKSFDGHMFQPHGIITTLPIELGGKIISFVMEVINAPLDYNLLLKCTWFYERIVIVSSVFRVLCFPHQGKIVMIDQLVFYTPNLRSNVRSNIPFVGDTQQSYMNVGVGMFKYPSLMGIFSLLPPPPTTKISPINMISSFTNGSLDLVDPCVVPHPKDVESYGSSMPLTTVKIFYPLIPLASANTSQHLHIDMECDQHTPPIWVFDSLSSHDFLDNEFPLDKAIENPWIP
jgi:hypothetical protein